MTNHAKAGLSLTTNKENEHKNNGESNTAQESEAPETFFTADFSEMMNSLAWSVVEYAKLIIQGVKLRENINNEIANYLEFVNANKEPKKLFSAPVFREYEEKTDYLRNRLKELRYFIKAEELLYEMATLAATPYNKINSSVQAIMSRPTDVEDLCFSIPKYLPDGNPVLDDQGREVKVAFVITINEVREKYYQHVANQKMWYHLDDNKDLKAAGISKAQFINENDGSLTFFNECVSTREDFTKNLPTAEGTLIKLIKRFDDLKQIRDKKIAEAKARLFKPAQDNSTIGTSISSELSSSLNLSASPSKA